MNKPIVLTEYPKSGGSWITSLLGEALGIPKRDIYMRPGFSLFDATDHPWYRDGARFDFPRQSVIKSHELPVSTLIDFDASYVHLARDGRDVIVSRWFFEKDFMVKNGITESFDKDFDSYVEEVATEWSEYVSAWSATPATNLRYEDFLNTPEVALGFAIKELTGVDMPTSVLEYAVSTHTKGRFSESLSKTFKHNTFVRRGVAGDWENHFSQKNADCFRSIAKDAMAKLGYSI
jgi:hypothetical protein